MTGTDSVPATVTVSAPSHSLGTLSDTLILTVTVKNQSGSVIPNAPVVWSSLSPQTATVTNGLVTAVKNGSAQIVALSGTISGQATVVVQQVAKTLTKASPDTQAGVFSHPLPQAIAVVAHDSGGHPAAGVMVGFKVAAGAGSVVADSVATDSLGRAADTWTLGNTLGVQKLVVTTSVLTIADSFFANGGDGLDSLPVTVATVQAGVALMTTGRIHVYANCSGSNTVNCPNGYAGKPIPLAVTQDSLSISQSSPGVYTFRAQVAVVTDSTQIPFTSLGLSCTMSINTAGGASPTVQVTGTATFTRQVASDPIDRIDMTNVAVSGLEAADLSFNGGTGCSLVSANLVGYPVLFDAFTSAAPQVCGTPGGGPPLVELCPPPPSAVSPRVNSGLARGDLQHTRLQLAAAVLKRSRRRSLGAPR